MPPAPHLSIQDAHLAREACAVAERRLRERSAAL
jgi:hypothetical protein